MKGAMALDPSIEISSEPLQGPGAPLGGAEPRQPAGRPRIDLRGSLRFASNAITIAEGGSE